MLSEHVRPSQHSSNIVVTLEIQSEIRSMEVFGFQDKQPPQITIKYVTPELLAALFKYLCNTTKHYFQTQFETRAHDDYENVEFLPEIKSLNHQ